MTFQKRDPWYIRLAAALGFKPESKEWTETRLSNGKHARVKRRPHDFDAKRKTRRKMADASRKINRRK